MTWQGHCLRPQLLDQTLLLAAAQELNILVGTHGDDFTHLIAHLVQGLALSWPRLFFGKELFNALAHALLAVDFLPVKFSVPPVAHVALLVD